MTSDADTSAELQALLAPTLGELEAVRAETSREIKARLRLRVPLGLAAGFAIWAWGGEREPFGLVQLLFFGGLAGWFWAEHQLSQAYRRLYKDRVLPQLATRFGALGYRKPVDLDPSRLSRHGVFDAFDAVSADDEIHGERHGLPVSIAEVTLTHGSGKNRRTVFDGLVAEVGLPRSLTGVTAIIAEGGMFGDLRQRFGKGVSERVRLEDPVFEERYQVYSSDQIAARALLTPAFIERFMALGARSHFGAPTALAEDNVLVMALPKTSGKNLFEPPSWRKPAASREALTELSGDIEAVLQVADSVIDLDTFARRAMPSV